VIEELLRQANVAAFPGSGPFREQAPDRPECCSFPVGDIETDWKPESAREVPGW